MRRTPYAERGISRVPCVKCGDKAQDQGRICATNAGTAVGRKCDEDINDIVAIWAFGKVKAKKLLDKYRKRFPDA